MNTAQLRCFLEVADTLNFARAAERLHITQPAVTQQIKSLEKEMGVRLFHRTTHSVHLTDEGLLFLGDAKQMIALENRAKLRFAGHSAEPFETLAFGCLYAQALALLAAPLARMRALRPGLHPALHIVPPRHAYRLLDEGSLDAVAAFRDLAGAAFTYRELLCSPMVCLCAADHPLAGRPAATAEDLRDTPLVLPAPSQVPALVRRQHEALLGARTPAGLYFGDTVDAVVTLAAAGYGVAVLPALLAGAPGTVQVPLQGCEPVSFGLYCKNLKDRPLLKAFLRYAQEPPHPGAKQTDAQ